MVHNYAHVFSDMEKLSHMKCTKAENIIFGNLASTDVRGSSASVAAMMTGGSGFLFVRNWLLSSWGRSCISQLRVNLVLWGGVHLIFASLKGPKLVHMFY